MGIANKCLETQVSIRKSIFVENDLEESTRDHLKQCTDCTKYRMTTFSFWERLDDDLNQIYLVEKIFDKIDQEPVHKESKHTLGIFLAAILIIVLAVYLILTFFKT